MVQQGVGILRVIDLIKDKALGVLQVPDAKNQCDEAQGSGAKPIAEVCADLDCHG